MNSALVKQRVLFKDASLYEQDREYRDFMNQTTSYSMMGKNKHDDTVDALALFVDWQMSDRSNVAQIIKRRF